jgi:hypothetical protein
MSWNFINSKKQGDFGVASAIAFFAKIGHTVSIPLTDSQDYDLVVEIEEKLCKVQIKTSSTIRYDNFVVDLRVKGGNRSGTGKTKIFDKTKVDYLFVITENGKMWLIPSLEINSTSSINLCDSYTQYQIV